MVEALLKHETQKETDPDYSGRQLLIDLKIPIKRDAVGRPLTAEETDEAALKRMDIRYYADLVVMDPVTKEVRQRTPKELMAKFPRVLLRVNDPKTGEMRLEKENELATRMAKGFGVKTGKDRWHAHDVADKAVGTRGAREGVSKAFANFDNKDFIKNRYRRDHESILKFANIPWESFKKYVLDDHEIDDDIKVKMWQIRRGKYARMIARIQAMVDGSEMVEGGVEYRAMILMPYNEQTILMKDQDEYNEFIRAHVPVVDENGRAYTKKNNKDGSIGVELGGSGDILYFDDFRQINAFMQGSGSTALVDSFKLFEGNERRNMARRKRKPVTDMRDEWSGIQIIFGEEGNPARLPVVLGTQQYDAIKRARDWAQSTKEAMEEIINGPDGRGPITTPAEVEEAHKRLRVALLVLEGLKDFTELKGLEGRARDDRIREIRAELYTATPERREELKKNDLYCILDRLIILEGGYPEDKKAKRPTGMSGWHKGKTKYEESKILGKREYWSPLLVFGITQKKLQTLLEAEGTDQEDLDALSYNVLMYRELPFIKLILTNDHLKDAFSWPDDQGLMDGINAERLRNFPDDDPLPLDPGPLIAEFKTEKKSGTLKEDEEE